ncbi:hypothetical protein KIKIMORA_02410 [Brevundimonas phage vB_BpoS-Kikimora]|uniref:Uncharacterized protein n=1 Tax=Brevundimonas phage vB_BpoS-Kikimora TaxID=2948601 RepID=A0A9E7SMT9_9CAUD|nr:hypothetical protein KIKIMORA_02410 [Brevundimonas phage vB_BpoS-Kikimora]
MTSKPEDMDLTSIVGLTPAQAALATGMTIRETFRNGSVLVVTKDYRTDRINVATDAGYITSVSGIG